MSLFKRLLNAVRAGSVSQDQWDEIRSALITADLGVKLADQVIEQAKSTKPEDAKQVIKEQLGAANGDPASVAFSAISKAKSEKYDCLIVDTAGRLHTKNNLMSELEKIIKVIEKQSPINEILLVIDATTGQNGINQAKSFIESAGVTGLILTKLDGGAKGGIGIAIEKEFGLPIKFTGWGEQITDLAAFDPEQYLDSLFE